ncbi:Site-specific recombinase XerD [Thermomonospora echinospora]|uniref:Site-specific recombinase XerD n=1 Tax=Thermomonospora echinospora TaxID=1992 RepID=A0A1H6E112_9ACTN|nr:site-specific integrase [Thermomonospora echinospora]SEG91101.1 Site-specific recombinase XerD [Thermomonospora echinospora]
MTVTLLPVPDEPEEPEESAGRKSRKSRSRKRANGEGTIYQRKDGRYEGAAFVPTTAGTFKRVRLYGRTHDEVRRKLTKLLEQADQGIPVAAESWTVGQYLTYWLDNVVRPERKPRTAQGYESVIRLYLIPELGNKRLGKLAARDVRAFISRVRALCLCCKHGVDAAREVPRCCALKGGECCQSRLSVRMVQSIHAVLRNALETAVREEVIPRNVAKLVQVSAPKYKVNRGLTVDQARAVLQAAKDERLYALYVLALCLGLRRGELLGLRWQDIALMPCRACDGEGGEADGAECEVCAGNGIESATLEVVQTLQRVGGALRFVRPKTDDSERTIPLPALCITALCEHKIRQHAERADAWPDWQDHGLVFPSRLGTPMEPDNLRRSWGRIRETAGLEGVRFHDMRHTCVSLLLHLGVAPDVVREIVGHSDIEVTMTIYAHTSLDEKRAALRKLGDALG